MIRSAIERRGSSASGLADTKVSAADLVTETDVAIENAIRSRIASTFPEHIIVGEEGTGDFVGESDRKGRFVWIIDPIDGTTNFVHAFPVVAVSIGVAFGDELVMGVVYNPLTDELWFAWKGCGAFFRRSSGTVSRIHTSKCVDVGSSIASTGFAVPLFRRLSARKESLEKLTRIVEHNTRILMTRTRDVRRIGSAACDICFVAMGRTDCYFEFGIKEWDIAAGLVILHEAGGDSSTIGGLTPYSIRGRNILVASSAALRHQMNDLLTDEDIVEIIEEIEK